MTRKPGVLVILCFLGVLSLLFSAIGCVVSPRRAPTPTPTPTPGPGQLYVSNQNTNAILRFDAAQTASGNVTPAATIAGTATQLSSPQYLALDPANDRLFVANENGSSVLIFDAVSSKSGNVAPTRTLAGAATGLITPSDVAFDKTRDLLYVADGPEILVFNSISSTTTNGNISFSRNATFTFSISAIFLDATNDRLYAADATNNAVNVFDNASTLAGITGATRSLSGTLTKLSQPSGVTLDPSGNLVVANRGGGGSITVYSNAATVSGNAAPIATIAGSNTTLAGPAQIVLNSVPTGGEVFVADDTAGGVAVFSAVASSGGNTAPVRQITGSATTLTVAGKQTARGVALDVTR